MALQFWDSFDHYAVGDILEKWTSSTGTLAIGAYGRMGTSGIRIRGYSTSDAYVRGPVSGPPDNLTIGFGWYTEEIPLRGLRALCGVLDGTTRQVILVVRNDGALEVYRGNRTALLAVTDPGVVRGDVYYYVEMQVVIDNAAGTVEVKLNEETVIDETGLDTQGSGTAQVTQFELGGDGTNTQISVYMRFDDLYVLDSSGAQCNDFLGDIRNYLLMPDGAGAHADFTPSAGANWQCVDDNPPNDDTDYNHSNTATDRDSFTFEDLPGGFTGTIEAFCAAINSRRDDAVAHQMEPSVRVGGTDYDGSAALITDAYSFYNLYAWELNPDIAGAWTSAAVNGAESGYELTV